MPALVRKPVTALRLAWSMTSGALRSHPLAQTRPESFASFKFLCRFSNGRLNDLLSRFLALRHPLRERQGRRGILGDIDPQKAARVVRRNGIHLLENRISPELCERIRAAAPSAISVPPKRTPNSADWRHVHECLEIPEVQQLICDPSLLRMAQAYLGAVPVFNLADLWWSRPGQGRTDPVYSHRFHVDIEGGRSVMFLIYLTDVGPDQGPHTYISGSHRRKPRALLQSADNGTYSDELIARHYAPQRWFEATGPVGTVLAVDPHGFHRGRPVLNGGRLVLLILFNNSQFSFFRHSYHLDGRMIPELRAQIRRHPRTYWRFRTPS